MTLLTLELEDPHDPRLARGAGGLLRTFNEAGVLDAADVHVAQRLCALAAEDDELVAMAAAVVVRAVRGGSVCVDLATVAEDAPDLSSPDADAWYAALAASPLVTADPPVLRLLDHDGVRLLYLDRYWREEEQVHADLVGRPAGSDAPDEAWLAAALDRVFPASGYDEQRAAARVALTCDDRAHGRPGHRQDHHRRGAAALCAEQAELAGDPAVRIALAAPTGKAAARLQQAVEAQVAKLPDADRTRLLGVRAVTLHRLLGSRPDTSSRFRHHRDNRLPHDVVVVDETSMVSLTMMARLLEAVRSGSRLILVGDPFQLASVEAGAVLADLVETVQEKTRVGVASLVTSHRFGESIGELAEAVRSGDADRAIELLEAGGDHVELATSTTPPAASASWWSLIRRGDRGGRGR